MITQVLPNDPLGQKLCRIFSYPWMTLEGDTHDATDPHWRTINKYPLKARALWAKFQDARKLAGVRFDKDTVYALIDIDKYSKFLTPARIQAIRDALETIGIVRTILIRSSWSGGAHLYIPLPEAVPTFALACAIRYTLEAQDMHIEQGELEVFPNTKAYTKGALGENSEYHGHRLPMQPNSGSQLLDDDLNPAGGSLAHFFQYWDISAKAQDTDALNEALTYGRDRHRKRQRRKPHPVDEWRAEWELDIYEGWTGPKQTNELLRVIAGYGHVFLKLEGKELHEFVVKTATDAPGFDEWCSHQFDIGRKAIAWCKSVEKYYWPLGDEPKRIDKAAFNINEERALDAQTRIKAAYEWLTNRGQWPETVTAQLKKSIAGLPEPDSTLSTNIRTSGTLQKGM